MKKLLILSGKGGTGKTTTAAAFIAFAKAKAFADCDVDAPNLHLISHVNGSCQKNDYYGSQKAKIDKTKCTNCGICLNHCRFDAIRLIEDHYQVNEFACEGCGVCAATCPANAAILEADIAGELLRYQGQQVFSTATLKMGRGNSGKLVTEVKKALNDQAAKLAIIDGSPGIGCPVIASISGVDLVLIVTEPSLSGISDLKRVWKTASNFGTQTAVCINKSDTCPENTEAIITFCSMNQIPFVGCIPYDRHVSEAINLGYSIAETNCPACTALKKVFHQTMSLIDTTKSN